MTSDIPLYLILALLAAWCVITVSLAVFIVGMLLTFRPWDGQVHRDYSWTAKCPYITFWLGTWISKVAGHIQALKPGPLRASELAIAYVQSHVLYVLVNLKIPDLLQSGPKSAADLAAEIGPSVNAGRLARVLNFAAACGMINKNKNVRVCVAASKRGKSGPAVLAGSQEGDDDHDSHGQPQSELTEALIQAPHERPGTSGPPDTASVAYALPETSLQLVNTPETNFLYTLNAVSACLCSASPSCVAHVVKTFEDQCGSFQHLSEGLLTGQIPFHLFSGGQDFWQHLNTHPQRAHTFDLAMAQSNQPAGPTIATAHPFRKYQVVIDVGGGVGGLLIDILSRHQKLRGILFDRPAQIERASELWSSVEPYKSLSGRVDLVSGDLFTSDSVPAPPHQEGKTGRVGYLLRNILHDWPDAECLTILRNIRCRITANDASRVMLLIIEATSMEQPCKSIYHYRLCSDLLMLSAFGDAKERSKQQFEALLASTGWQLTSVKPTNGLYMILTARPV